MSVSIDDMPHVMGEDGEFHAQDEAVDLSGTTLEAWVARPGPIQVVHNRNAAIECPSPPAGVTQSVECLLPKQDVAGSNPVSRSKLPNLRGMSRWS